jgi:class 3 adenylate cyclase
MSRTDPIAAAVPDMANFPDRNPNPVMHVTRDGMLAYANAASEPILRSLGVDTGDVVPAAFLAQLHQGSVATPPVPFELPSDVQTFEVLAVPADEGMNVYGTDITARQVVARFPDRNPHPVIRITPEGMLVYANRASRGIAQALGLVLGKAIPGELREQIQSHLEKEPEEPIQIRGDGRVYALTPVPIPEFEFINLYGVDVTAGHAVNSFPDENPNPVLRMARDGTLTYANPASALVRQAIGAEVGGSMPAPLLQRIRAVTDGRGQSPIEVEHAGRIFELHVVGLFEFESINLYGTDVTAARQIEKAHRENERLLLNILPSSIAQRLRGGEELIADAFEEMAVLFADVVDFTPYSATRPAREVVAVLNEIFSIFDNLVDRHRLEKIKTVGDAYMVVGGISPDGGGVVQVADMALDMISEMGRYRTEAGVAMQIRVGLHIGPGIGGVIGLKKFIYDVWGDTVNTASRMESHGEPGRIQVTAETARRLEHGYRLERRGVVEVKGKGQVETFFLLSHA